MAPARVALADDAAHVPRRGLRVGARDRGGQLDGRRVHGACGTASRSSASRRRRPRRRRSRRCCSSAATSRARVSTVLLDAWDGHRPRRASCRSSASGRRPTSCSAARVGDVEWFGTVTDAPRNELLRGATVFCAPSLRGESFGVVLLEAMAAGTPIVASAIEGYQNVARPGQDALLVPPGDVGALRDALRRLLDDPALRARLVASGHERAEQFSMRAPGRALPGALRPGAGPGDLADGVPAR